MHLGLGDAWCIKPGRLNYIIYSVTEERRKSGPDASGQGFEWLQRHPSSGSSPGGNIESNPFGTVGKYVFRGTERSVEMPVVPSFMTCDLCVFLGDALTLGRSTDTYFFDAQDGQPWSSSACVLAACRCKLLVLLRNSKFLYCFILLEVESTKMLFRYKSFFDLCCVIEFRLKVDFSGVCYFPEAPVCPHCPHVESALQLDFDANRPCQQNPIWPIPRTKQVTNS